jgi:uncharacterized protein
MRATKEAVGQFMSQKTFALVGVSRNERKFGNAIYKELTKKSYKVFPINLKMTEIQGEKCYSSLNELPEKPGGVIVCVKKDETEKVVKEAVQLNIKNIWMQQGSETDEAINYCKENNVNVVYKECVIMFAQPVDSVHKVHRFFKKIFGALPK